MNLYSIRLITNDVDRLASFYEHVTHGERVQTVEIFAEIYTESALLAIGSSQTLLPFDGTDSLMPESNNSAILEFRVNDVDAEYERLKDYLGVRVVQKPKSMPWGNRSLLVSDPDGTMVNLFTPVSPEAIERWGSEDGGAASLPR